MVVDLERKGARISQDISSLVGERERSEIKRKNMMREREAWSKVKIPEDRVPPGAHWKSIQPAHDCHAYGKREYWGALLDVPKGWSAMDACMNTPTEIEGITMRRPDRCAFIDGSSEIHGYWMVDWDQRDCNPELRNLHDAGCTNSKSGLARIEADVAGIINGDEQGWRVMCESVPLSWGGINYTSPTHCEERGFFRNKVAMWDVPAERCRY